MTTNFKGPFTELLQDFIEFKRSMEFKYVKEAEHLKHFSEFSFQFKLEEPVLTKDILDAWCMKPWCMKRPYENYRNDTEQRITCLRQFTLYLVSIGHNTYIPYTENKNQQVQICRIYILMMKLTGLSNVATGFIPTAGQQCTFNALVGPASLQHQNANHGNPQLQMKCADLLNMEPTVRLLKQ